MDKIQNSDTKEDASLTSSASADEVAHQDDKQSSLDTSVDAISNVDQSEKTGPTLEETLQAHLEKVGKEASQAADDDETKEDSEESESEGDVSKTNKTEEEEKIESEKTDESTEDEKPDAESENADSDESLQEKGPVPYERFHEKTQEVADKTNEIARLSPLAKRQEVIQSFQAQNQITDNELVEALEMAALMKTDPEGFAKKMRPVLEGIGVLSGETLPDDLSQQANVIRENVSTGAMPAETGEMLLGALKETAKLRAQLKYGGERQKTLDNQRQRAAEQQAQQATVKAFSDWTNSVSKKDPSFKAKANAAAEDGLYELVDAKITHLYTARNPDGSPANPVRTPGEFVKLAQTAYDSVSRALGRQNRRPSVKGALSSNGSRNRTGDKDFTKAKTLEEALSIGLGQLQSGKRPH